jgi:hypothetical protein
MSPDPLSPSFWVRFVVMRLSLAQDPFAELVSISVTWPRMISVVGRNFGSKLNVDMIILAACLPIMAGFLMASDPYMRLMAVLLLPLFLTTRSMANGVRDFLFNSVTAERKTAEIAETVRYCPQQHVAWLVHA